MKIQEIMTRDVITVKPDMDVRQLARRDRGGREIEPRALDRELGGYRHADPPVHLRHHRVEAIFGLDELAQAAARAREPLEECAVDRLIDAEREHADVLEARGRAAHELILVANLTIGDEHDHSAPWLCGSNSFATPPFGTRTGVRYSPQSGAR